RPDTGYGYIQYIDENDEKEFKKVKTFTEKPDLEIAKTFLQSGDFLWNSGIFIWSADSIIKSLKKYVYELNEIFAEGVHYLNSDRKSTRLNSSHVKISYAVFCLKKKKQDKI